MATETVSSDHSSTVLEQVLKELHEEMKPLEQSVPLPKEVEEKPKEEEILSANVPPAVPDDVPVSDKVELSKPEIKDVEKPQEAAPKEAAEEKLEEQPKEIEIPESATENAEVHDAKVEELLKKIEIPQSVIVESKEVQSEELPPKEPVAEVVKNVEVSAADKKEEEEASGEIEKPAANGCKKDETIKDEEVEKKVDVEEPPKAETETKADAPIQEPAKEAADDQLKTVQEAPKKHSNNLLAKVKQSLVKAKKAIIGKSQPKTPPPPSSETKEEVKAA